MAKVCAVATEAETSSFRHQRDQWQASASWEVAPPTAPDTLPLGVETWRAHHFRARPTPEILTQDPQIVAFLPACPPASLARVNWRPHPDLVQRTVSDT